MEKTDDLIRKTWFMQPREGKIDDYYDFNRMRVEQPSAWLMSVGNWIGFNSSGVSRHGGQLNGRTGDTRGEQVARDESRKVQNGDRHHEQARFAPSRKFDAAGRIIHRSSSYLTCSKTATTSTSCLSIEPTFNA